MKYFVIALLFLFSCKNETATEPVVKSETQKIKEKLEADLQESAQMGDHLRWELQRYVQYKKKGFSKTQADKTIDSLNQEIFFHGVPIWYNTLPKTRDSLLRIEKIY